MGHGGGFPGAAMVEGEAARGSARSLRAMHVDEIRAGNMEPKAWFPALYGGERNG
jgi:hypothetical protein